MAISAQHTQFVTNEYISPIPSEDLIKVALKKQDMYDEGRKQIKQVYDNYGKLRSTIINENAKNYFDQEFNKLVKNVQQNAGLDFANLGNVEAVINLGKPFENDKYIKTALDNGIEYQRRMAEMNSMDKDKRSADNDLVYMYDANDYIENGGLDTKLSKNKTYQQYVDISAKMRELEKEVEAETFTTFEEGPRGYLQQVEHKRKTREDIYNRLITSLSPEEQAQFQIHAQANMLRMGNDVLYQTWVGANKEEKLLATETRKSALQQLAAYEKIKKPTATDKEAMNRLQQIISTQEEIIGAADENIRMNPDDFDMGEYLPFFTKRFVDGISKQLAFNQTKSELKEDRVYMANLENNLALSRIRAQANAERETLQFKDDLDYTTQSGSSINLLSGIGKFVSAPTKTGSAGIQELITSIEGNTKLNAQLKQKYLSQLKSLAETYRVAESNKNNSGYVVSINRGLGKGYTTSLSDFLSANPIDNILSGAITSIEVRKKTATSTTKASKTPEQIQKEEAAKTAGDLEAKAKLYKENPEMFKLLYGSKSSSGGGGIDPEVLRQMQQGLNSQD